MTVIFHDVHAEGNLQSELEQDRPIGYSVDEVLYADDTVLFSTDEETLEKYLHKIQTIGKKYGLNLNMDKCENLNLMNHIRLLQF